MSEVERATVDDSFWELVGDLEAPDLSTANTDVVARIANDSAVQTSIKWLNMDHLDSATAEEARHLLVRKLAAEHLAPLEVAERGLAMGEWIVEMEANNGQA